MDHSPFIQQVSLRWILLTGALLLWACPYGYKYNTGTLPEEPVNLTDINSEWDDYNASAPFIRDEFPLVFSSNRNSQGQQMDVIYKLMALDFDKETGELRFYNETDPSLDITNRFAGIQQLTNRINSPANELGPYVKAMAYDVFYEIPIYTYGEERLKQFLILYATDSGQQLDIAFFHNFTEMEEPEKLTSVNTPFNEAYPCFSHDFSTLYFCSDRAGQFDLYETDWNNSQKLEITLADSLTKAVNRIETLSSGSQDKCPYFDQEYLVFASDRPGGFGGFDLYWARLSENGWSQPVNFGSKINSPFDEYRPILRLQGEFTSHLLIFSSNRPGGLGGFDLYFSGCILD